MNKVLVVGIDGMDPDLIVKWEHDLPNLKKLMKEGTGNMIESVFPPDSVQAWATIFTGKSPVNLGIMAHSNVFLESMVKINISNMIGQTFWDIAGKAGKKVCIINPFLAYPVWPVNGTIISGPVFISGDIQMYPAGMLKDTELPDFGGITDFPDKRNLDIFIRKNKADIEKLYHFASRRFIENDYDICFVTFLQLDRIQHFLWRYSDSGDDTYPGPNPFINSIKEFYCLFDGILGKFISALDSNTSLLVISDHGHGRRCTTNININEFLRQKEYLFSEGNKMKMLNYKFLIEKIKVAVLIFFNKYDMQDFLYKITPYIPYKKSLKSSSFLMDSSRNLAEVDSRFSGVNPFGGIRINKSILESLSIDYNKFRNQLIQDISELNSDGSGKEIFKWICAREDIYSGEYIELYPDILFELDSEYGVSPSLHTTLFSKNTTHKKISGGHRRFGFLGMLNVPKVNNNVLPKLEDIAPTILNLIEVDQLHSFDGKSLFC